MGVLHSGWRPRPHERTQRPPKARKYKRKKFRQFNLPHTVFDFTEKLIFKANLTFLRFLANGGSLNNSLFYIGFQQLAEQDVEKLCEIQNVKLLSIWHYLNCFHF